MNYYILSQGTKSLDNSFLIFNGKIVDSVDINRSLIHKLFNETEKRGVIIRSSLKGTKIIKHKNNFLVEVLTTNTDRLNRKIPVELLLENYGIKSTNNIDLHKIYLLLQNEQIDVEVYNWIDILNQINRDLSRFNKKTNIKIILSILTLLVLFYTFYKIL